MNTIKVAFVASTLEVGGAENVLVNLVKGLAPDRFQCELFFLRESGPLGRELLRLGYSGVERLQRHRMDPTVLFRFARRLRLFSPHVLFALDHHNVMLWGGLSSLIAGVPLKSLVSDAIRF